MESYFKFLQNCCNTEEKINTYVQNKAIRSREKIMLNNVVEIFFKCIKEEETLSSIIEGIKQEFMEDRVIDAFVYQKGETSNCILCTCDMKDSSCLRCHAKLEEDALDTKGIITETVTWEVNNKELRIETENSLIKQEDTLNEMTGEQTEAKSGMCICKITRKTCIRCNSQFEIVSTKPKLYKCNLCPYQGMGIKSHMLKHRDISEVRVYQCDKCLFQTKRKQDLKIHLFTHGIYPEVQVYKCDICEYHTKYKSCLKSHLLTHKGFSEVQVIYQCDVCEYQSKQKRYLTQHLLTHEDFSNIQMFQCVSCEYQTKRKGDLKKHVMTHKNSAEVHSYQCDSCEYQTSQKRYLRRHLLIHNSFFLTQNMFQCKSCEYRTKYKHYMKSHLLAHHSPSETQVYQCDSCEYQTKHRGSLLNHKLTHKDFSEVKTYQCDSCKYQTKRNGDLKKHLKTHKNLPHALITTL